MSAPSSIVIVGAGHGGVQAAASLRDEGFGGRIALVGDEMELPYHRPPLSKAFLKGEVDHDGLALRAEAFFHEHRIDLVFGSKATALDRGAKRLELESGLELNYDHLILATGARARELKIPASGFSNVHALRAVRDAVAIRAELGEGKRVVIIGAGFIGLEIAATAQKLGGLVTILEIADRAMGRAISPAMSSFFADAHRTFGADLKLMTGVAAIRGAGGRATEVETTTGEILPADAVIVGVGIVAEDALALQSGLHCDNGIVVDETMTTSDPSIYAIGDCASFPSRLLDRRVRLESVQNATDQAKCAAKAIMGKPSPYDALPWFWSDQGDLKLQIAGLSHFVDTWVTRGDPASRAFAVFGFLEGSLGVVETVNKGAEHMAARRLIPARTAITPEQAGDLSFDLRKLAMSLKPA